MPLVRCVRSPMQTVENRLFSEGLHVLGEPPSQRRMQQYLEAYFDGALPEEALTAVSSDSAELEQVKARLERSLDLVKTLADCHMVCLWHAGLLCCTSPVGCSMMQLPCLALRHIKQPRTGVLRREVATAALPPLLRSELTAS